MYCFVCETYTKGDGAEAPSSTEEQRTDVHINSAHTHLKTRKISKDTCVFYDYSVGAWSGEPAQFAQYHHADGKKAGIKIRRPDKKFFWIGTQPGTFYGQHRFSGGKMLVITEGEIDALSYAETHGCKWPTVSIPNGAKGASAVFKKNLEWLRCQ